MLAQTEDLIKRVINISVGVSDVGLGSDYGIGITITQADIESKARNLVEMIRECL